MKKSLSTIIVLILVLGVMPFVISGCGEEEKETEATQVQTVTIEETTATTEKEATTKVNDKASAGVKEYIVGKWKFTNVKTEKGEIKTLKEASLLCGQDLNKIDMECTFNKDGSYHYVDVSQEFDGTYTISGNTVIVKDGTETGNLIFDPKAKTLTSEDSKYNMYLIMTKSK